MYRASGLNLLIAAIVLWNTVYISHAIKLLQEQGEEVPEEYLQHLSPLGWEHCETYVCGPSTKRFDDLRESIQSYIIKSGANTAILAINNKIDFRLVAPQLLTGGELPKLTYSPTPFDLKRSHSEIKLKDLCSSKLWGQLQYEILECTRCGYQEKEVSD